MRDKEEQESGRNELERERKEALYLQKQSRYFLSPLRYLHLMNRYYIPQLQPALNTRSALLSCFDPVDALIPWEQRGCC